MLKPLNRNGEYVSNAPFGPDDARGAGIAFELTSEAKNLHVNATVEDILVNTGRLQQVLATQRTLRRFEKGKQHGILAFGQRDRYARRVGKLSNSTVELPTGKS